MVEASDESKCPTWVKLNPVLDYADEPQFAHGAQGQVAIVGRMRGLMSNDHNIAPAPLYVRVAEIQYVDDLQDFDRNNAISMLKNAQGRMEERRLQAESNLIVTNQMPQGEPHAPGRA